MIIMMLPDGKTVKKTCSSGRRVSRARSPDGLRCLAIGYDLVIIDMSSCVPTGHARAARVTWPSSAFRWSTCSASGGVKKAIDGSCSADHGGW